MRNTKKFKSFFVKVLSLITTTATILWLIGAFLFLPQVAYAQPVPTDVGGPQDGEMGVPIDALVDRGFNTALDPNTVNTTNVKLQANDGNTQAGTPTGPNLCTSVNLLDSNTRIECIHDPLNTETWYTFTITTGVTDAGSNPLASNATYAFQTSTFGGGSQFNPPPFVISTMPPNGGSLPANGKFTITFSSSNMNTSGEGSVLDFTNNIQLYLVSGGTHTGSNLFTGATTGSWDGTRSVLTITPNITLTVGSPYRLIIKGDNNQDPGDGSCGGAGEPACVMNGDNLAFPGPDYFVDFTATAQDNTAPSVIGSHPDTGAISIDRVLPAISISFDEVLDPATVSTSSVQLIRDVNGNDLPDDAVISGTTVALDPDGRTIHLSPNTILNANSKYFVVLKSNGIADVVVPANTLSSDVVRNFTTGSNVNGQATDNTKPSVVFANADNFGLFVTISEPVQFDLTANVSESSSSGVNDVNNLSNWTVETSFDGTNWNQVPLTGKTVRYEPHNMTLEIENLALPPNDQFRITASTNIKDLAGNTFSSTENSAQGTVQTAQDTGGMLGPGEMAGGPDFFTMGTSPIAVFPKSAAAGATTRYMVEFPANTQIPASGKITLTYPSGFSFASSCNTWPTETFENEDINGPAPGVVTVSSIACDPISRIVTITLGSTATQAGDMIRFEIQGVINTTVPKDFSTSGYTVDIKTYDASNVVLETKTSMPFFIAEPGQRTISGKVFIDDGTGGGTANDGIPNGGESGVQNVKVCMGGPYGFDCKSTDSNGDFSFTNLNDGFYHIDIPPLTSGNVTGGPFFRDINVSGSNVTNVYFPLQQADPAFILDVYITGGTALASTKLDVFAFSSAGAGIGPSPGGPGPGGFVVRELTLDSSGVGTTTLPLAQGKWEVGVGPWMPKEPGAPPPPPDFTFMPPKPVQVEVSSTGVPDLCTSGAGAAANELCFTLTAATNQIQGKVVDGSGNAIPNTFVMARPAFFGATDPGAAGAAQTDSNGRFNIKVVTGTYILDAFMPGMPPSRSFECTVKDNDTSVSDNNNTADVYCNGVLIVNDVTGFDSSSLNLNNVTDNDLVLTIAKADTSISGRVLDDAGNAIPFAHVEGMEVDANGNPTGGWVDAPTDNSGNYTLYVTGGPSGSPKTWRIRAFAPGFGELPAITVGVTQGQNLTGQNLQVVAGDFVTVTGTVYIDTDGDSTPDSGEGVGGAFVGIHGPGGGNGTVSSSDGSYSVKVKSGTGYTIEGFVPGQGPTEVLSNQDLSTNQTGKNLKMAQPGTIVVYVCTLSDPSSSPSATNNCASNQVTDAFVDARDAGGRGHGTGSNPTSGQYEIVLPAGTYTVRANHPAIGLMGSQSNVTVTANGTTYVSIVPPALYTVSGTASSSNAACVEGATVALTDATNGRMILARVDANGNWTATNVPNGAYSVGAGKPGCVDAADFGGVTVAGSNVTVSDDTDLARTLVKADVTVTGRVTLPNGNNVSFDTMVFAESGTGKIAVAEVDTSQTGTNNNYTLELVAGSWTIKARSDGYESSAVSLTVTSGQSVTQNLALSAITGYTRKEAKPYSIKPSRGGIVKNTDISSDFEVNIPAGALGTSSDDGSVLTKETTSVVDTTTDAVDVLADKGIEVTPKNASGQPIKTLSSSEGSAVTITIPYDEADVTAAGGTESQIYIGVWSDEKQQWEALPTTCDTTNNKCTATVTHFSAFAPLVPTAGGAPSTPSGLTATAVSTSQIDLSWTAVSGVTGYDIYRDTSSGGSFPRLGSEPTVSAGTTTYSDTGLSHSTTYYYKVSALNSAGESAASSAVSATTHAAGVVPVGGGGGPTPVPTEEEAVAEEEVAEEEVVEEVPAEEEIEVTLPTIPTLEKPVSEMTIEELQVKIAEFLAAIEQLQALLAQLEVPPAPEVVGIPTDYKFERNLRFGEVSDDIKYLQIVLNADPDTQLAESGPGSPGEETTYFGPLTKAAVIRFQEKYAQDILAPWELTKGTGFVGKTTRAKLNEILGQ